MIFNYHFGKRSDPPCIDCDGDQCTMNCSPRIDLPRSAATVLQADLREEPMPIIPHVIEFFIDSIRTDIKPCFSQTTITMKQIIRAGAGFCQPGEVKMNIGGDADKLEWFHDAMTNRAIFELMATDRRIE